MLVCKHHTGTSPQLCSVHFQISSEVLQTVVKNTIKHTNILGGSAGDCTRVCKDTTN